jgi:hypothetical protein
MARTGLIRSLPCVLQRGRAVLDNEANFREPGNMKSDKILNIFEWRGKWHGGFADADKGEPPHTASLGWSTKAQATHEMLLVLDGLGQLPAAVGGHADRQAASAFGVPMHRVGRKRGASYHAKHEAYEAAKQEPKAALRAFTDQQLLDELRRRGALPLT